MIRHQQSQVSNCDKAKRVRDLATAVIQAQRRELYNWDSTEIIDIANSIPTPPPRVTRSSARRTALSDAFSECSSLITTRTVLAQQQLAQQQQQSHLSSIIYHIGRIKISVSDMATLSQEGEMVVDNIIDAFQHISQQGDWGSLYFHLAFFQCLITVAGYEFLNVADWVGEIDIFTKKFLYIPVVYNSHYILFVVDIDNNTIRCYDPLGINRREMMWFIVMYLHDMFHMEERGQDAAAVFNMSDWERINVFTATTKIQFNSVDCGVFLMKFIQLVQQSNNVSQLCQNNMVTYREDLVTIIQNFQT